MMQSARFLTSPSVQVVIPTSSMAMSDGPWQTVAPLSTIPPTFSAMAWPALMAWQLVLIQPNIRVFLDLTSIRAVRSMASSYDISL